MIDVLKDLDLAIYVAKREINRIGDRDNSQSQANQAALILAQEVKALRARLEAVGKIANNMNLMSFSNTTAYKTALLAAARGATGRAMS